MPVIDMNVPADVVSKLDTFELLESGTYEFQIRNIEQKQTGQESNSPGRPMLTWELEIIGHPQYQGRRVFYNTVLPWVNQGQLDTSGCGLLVAITKGVRKPWTGSAINTEDYLGLTGPVVIGQAPIKKGGRAGEMGQTIKIVVPKE